MNQCLQQFVLLGGQVSFALPRLPAVHRSAGTASEVVIYVGLERSSSQSEYLSGYLQHL